MIIENFWLFAEKIVKIFEFSINGKKLNLAVSADFFAILRCKKCHLPTHRA